MHSLPAIERLEARRLLSCDVGFENGILTVTCDDGDNNLEIRDSVDAVSVLEDGQELGTWREVLAVHIFAMGGNDQILYTGLEAPAGDQSTRDIVIELGDGDDTFEHNETDWSFARQLARATIYLDLGDGTDEGIINSALPVLDLNFSGSGDNTLAIGLLLPAVQIAQPARINITGNFPLDGLDRLELIGASEHQEDDDGVPGPIEGSVEVVLNTGGGDDTVITDLRGLEGLRTTYDLDMGEGDNSAQVRFGDGADGQRLPTGQGSIQARYRFGSGLDTLDIEVAGLFEQTVLDIAMGGGNDSAEVGVETLEIVHEGFLESSLDIDLDLGAGDDHSDVRINGKSAGLDDIVTGAGVGGGPHVRVFEATSSAQARNFLAYPPSFRGGVRVATGDVNGDTFIDVITAPGPGAGGHVKVFDGLTGALVRSFLPYGGGFRGGVYVAAGDVNGDGVDDIVTGADGATTGGVAPHVKVFDGRSGAELRSFFAYDPAFTGGVRVAAGDINGDGLADIITGAGPGGGSHVKVFSGADLELLSSFLAFPGFNGGVFVAAGDVNGDGFVDVVTGADAGGGPHVKVFDLRSQTLLHSFFAYGTSFQGGVRVAAGDVNGDGLADIITGTGPGGGSHVRVFDGANAGAIRGITVDPSDPSGEIYVAAGDLVTRRVSASSIGASALGGEGNDTSRLTARGLAAHEVTHVWQGGPGHDAVHVDLEISPLDAWLGVGDPQILDLQLDGGAGSDSLATRVRRIAFAGLAYNPEQYTATFQNGPPEVGDEVLVAFESGDPSATGDGGQTTVIGGLWVSHDTPVLDPAVGTLQVTIVQDMNLLDAAINFAGGAGDDQLDVVMQLLGDPRDMRALLGLDGAGGHDDISLNLMGADRAHIGVGGGAGNDTIVIEALRREPFAKDPRPGGASELVLVGRLGAGDDLLRFDSYGYRSILSDIDTGPQRDGQDLMQGTHIAPGATGPTRKLQRRMDRGNDFAVWITVGFFEVQEELISPTRQILSLGA